MATLGETLSTTTFPGGGGAAGLVLIEKQTVTGAAATTLTFSGLDGDLDKLYFVTFRVLNTTSGLVSWLVNPNGITANQDSRRQSFDDAGVYTVNSVIGRLRAGLTVSTAGTKRHGFGTLYLHADSATNRYMVSTFACDAANNFRHETHISEWADATTNITSLEFEANAAGGIGVGSEISLYKVTQ